MTPIYLEQYHTDKEVLFCNVMGVLPMLRTDGNWIGTTTSVPFSHGTIQLDPENCFIAGISVSDTFRRVGKGNELMDALEDVASRNNCTEVNLLVETGTFMHDWYSRRGYEAYSEEVIEEVPMVWMRKELKMDEQ